MAEDQDQQEREREQEQEEQQQYQVNRELFELMLSKVREDQYPSPTMLDIVEKLMTPGDIETYGRVLMEKISAETYPSMSLVRRVMALQ